MKNINELIQEKAKKLVKKSGHEYSQKYDEEKEIEKQTKFIIDYASQRIPSRYKDVCLDQTTWGKVEKNIKEGKGLFFCGPIGTGKTYTLYAIFRYLLVLIDMDKVDAQYPGNRVINAVKLLNFPNMLSSLRNSYSENRGAHEEEFGLKHPGILLIDDFGAEKTTEWNIEIMYRLVNYRYEHELPTFFASNLSLQELSEKSCDRVASRISEMCEVVEMVGEDKRLN